MIKTIEELFPRIEGNKIGTFEIPRGVSEKDFLDPLARRGGFYLGVKREIILKYGNDFVKEELNIVDIPLTWHTKSLKNIGLIAMRKDIRQGYLDLLDIAKKGYYEPEDYNKNEHFYLFVKKPANKIIREGEFFYSGTTKNKELENYIRKNCGGKTFQELWYALKNEE